MKGRNQGLRFIFCSIIGIISLLLIIFIFFRNMSLNYTGPFSLFIFILFWLSFNITVISIYEIYTNLKNKINNKKEMERNTKDIYQYQKLIDPPDTDINN
jgi:hypothetical protein